MVIMNNIKIVKFGTLNIGDKFGCWGDYHLNYNYPRWCECEKFGVMTGRELNGDPPGTGILFCMSESDEVTISVE